MRSRIFRASDVVKTVDITSKDDCRSEDTVATVSVASQCPSVLLLLSMLRGVVGAAA